MSGASKPGALCAIYQYQVMHSRIYERSLLRGYTVLMRCRSTRGGALASSYDHIEHRARVNT